MANRWLLFPLIKGALQKEMGGGERPGEMFIRLGERGAQSIAVCLYWGGTLFVEQALWKGKFLI